MKHHPILLGLLLLTFGLTLTSACGDTEEGPDACDPQLDPDCFSENNDCLLPNRDRLAVECGEPIDNNGTNNGTNNETNNGSPPKLLYVLIEDLTAEPQGDAPGADLDAVSVTTPDGVEHFVTHVDDYLLSDDNAWTDLDQIKGAPDSGCMKQGFVSLGGADADGYVIVSFSSDAEEVTIDSGSLITVYELGPTSCPHQPEWDDNPYKVSVSISHDRASFIELGTGGPGQSIIPVP